MQWFHTLGPNGMSGARAAFGRKCNGKYNGMCGARAAFEQKLKGHLMDGNYIN